MKAAKMWLSFTVSALLFASAMSFPQTLWFLGLIFFVPILIVLDQREDLAFKSILKPLLLFGFISITFSSLWFFSAYPLDWLQIENPFTSIFIISTIWLLFGAVMSLPLLIWLIGYIYFHNCKFACKASMGASLWVVMEYVRSWVVALGVYGQEVLLGPHHTYYSLGYLAAHAPILKHLLPVGGLHLVSFVFILVNYILCGFVLKKNSKALIIILLGIISFSFFLMQNIRKDSSAEIVNVTLINTQVSALKESEAIEKRKEVTSNILKNLENKRSFIVFPENFGFISSEYFSHMRTPKTQLQQSTIVGSYLGERFSNLFFYDLSNNAETYYRKQILMPVAEYPVILVKWMADLFTSNDLIAPQRGLLSKGEHISLFKFEPLGVYFFGSLCSENISPLIYRKATRLGANVLINIASHAPFHNSPLLSRQTLAINSARALENGRYLVTASNGTESFIVNDKGGVIKIISSKGVYSYDDVQVEPKKYTTPYVLFGDYMVYFSFMMIGICLLWRGK